MPLRDIKEYIKAIENIKQKLENHSEVVCEIDHSWGPYDILRLVEAGMSVALVTDNSEETLNNTLNNIRIAKKMYSGDSSVATAIGRGFTASEDVEHGVAMIFGSFIVEKAKSSAYTEVTRVTSPYMESTMTKVSPVMEMVSPMVEFVSPMVDSVKTRGEEQLMTHVPSGISETVQSVQVKAVDQVVAAFEKVNVDFNY